MRKIVFTVLSLIAIPLSAHAGGSVFDPLTVADVPLSKVSKQLVDNGMVCNKALSTESHQGVIIVRCLIEDEEFEYTILSKKEYTLAEAGTGIVIKVVSR